MYTENALEKQYIVDPQSEQQSKQKQLIIQNLHNLQKHTLQTYKMYVVRQDFME